MENSSPQLDPARLHALYEAVCQLNATLDESDVIQRVLDFVLKLMKAERAFLQLANSPTMHIAPNPAQGLTAFFSSVSETLAAQMAQARTSIYISDWQEFLNLAAGHLPAFMIDRTIAIAELKIQQQVIEMLIIDRVKSGGVFTVQEKNTLELFASWCSIAIANAQLRRSAGDLVFSLMHDMRAPLHAIKAYSYVAVVEESQAQTNLNKELYRTAQKAVRLFHEYSDMAQIEFGTIRLSLDPVEIRSCISECLVEQSSRGIDERRLLEAGVLPEDVPVGVEYWLREKKLTVNLDLPQLLAVRADHSRLKQIINEALLETAYRLTPGERINISAAQEAASITVQIHSPTLQDNLPMLSYRSIAKRLIELMGGTIGFESGPGKGGTFWFTLPIAEPEASSNS